MLNTFVVLLAVLAIVHAYKIHSLSKRVRILETSVVQLVNVLEGICV